jgi:lysophospholipase L1-like esterase
MIPWAGWLVTLLLLGLVGPKIIHRAYVRLPIGQKEDFARSMSLKKTALSKPWQDQRPLVIITGDSHVEFGNWYEYFDGAVAVRNCGLARARIEDVTELVAAMGDRFPQAVVVLCGVNNLAGPESVDSCLSRYQSLIALIQTRLRPGKVFIVAVMPFRATPVDQWAKTQNARINEFNRELMQLCQREHLFFVDANPALKDVSGGLNADLTSDGLHLNPEGYRRLAAALLPHLTSN